jgi:hypothetical protein
MSPSPTSRSDDIEAAEENDSTLAASVEEEPLGVAESARGLAIQVLIAEFQYVSGMIAAYRRLESFTVAGTGFVFTGSLGAYAALEAGASPQPTVQATLFAVAAWGPTLLMLVQATALTRIRRASAYIRTRLRPLAVELTCVPEIMLWEDTPAPQLVLAIRDDQSTPLRGIRFFLSSVPMIAIHVATTIALSVFACVQHPSVGVVATALTALLANLIVARYAYQATMRHENRAPKRPSAESTR